MPKKHAPEPSATACDATTTEQPTSMPHHDTSSPEFVHANDRMKLAAKPNDGEPLSHRNRAKAGRKG